MVVIEPYFLIRINECLIKGKNNHFYEQKQRLGMKDSLNSYRLKENRIRTARYVNV